MKIIHNVVLVLYLLKNQQLCASFLANVYLHTKKSSILHSIDRNVKDDLWSKRMNVFVHHNKVLQELGGIVAIGTLVYCVCATRYISSGTHTHT